MPLQTSMNLNFEVYQLIISNVRQKFIVSPPSNLNLSAIEQTSLAMLQAILEASHKFDTFLRC